VTIDLVGWALTAARAAHLAALLSAFGVLVFWTLVAPPVLRLAEVEPRAGIETAILKLFRSSLALALAMAILWLGLQAIVLAEPETAADAVDALWPVLSDTHFGHILSLRVALMVLALLALGDGSASGRRRLGAIVTGLALILHAWATHAAAAQGIDRPILLTVESLHLLAAGGWLGSLAPLLVIVGRLPANQGALAARRFSPLGMVCAATLAGTALIQGGLLIRSLSGLFGTDYGLVALAKLTMLVVLLGLAAANRFLHLPGLTGSTAPDAKRRLRRNIGLETTIGLAAVLAAAFLSSLPPARHAQSAWEMNLPALGEVEQSSQSEQNISVSADSADDGDPVPRDRHANTGTDQCSGR